MTDNARIVREALEDATSPFITDGPCQASLMNPRGQDCMCRPCVKHRVREVAPAALTALETDLATAKAREAGLTKALAEVQADLERARGALDDIHSMTREFVGRGYRYANLEEEINHIARTALAPEQKGDHA